MKRYLMIMAVSLASSNLQGQRLFPGEFIGGISSKDVINWQKDSIDLSGLKGKMILLDFWNHSCISCIQGFYKLDSLQKKNKDKLQVILVCKESRDSTLKFFAKRKKISYYDLPLITNAEKIWARFNPGKNPCHGWIDAHGRFQYLTGSNNFTQKNIDAFLSGSDLALLNMALPGNYEIDEKVFKSSESLYQSTLKPCDIKNMRVSRVAAELNNGTARTYLPCESVLGLYKKAYEENGKKYQFFSRAHIVLNVTDSFLYIKPSDASLQDSWRQTNAYAYEQIIPSKDKNMVYQYMQDDLRRFFGLEVKIEKREIPALYLVRKDKIDRIKTKGGNSVDEFKASSLRTVISDSLRQVSNIDFAILFKKLVSNLRYHHEITLVDKTGYSGKIDIEFREISVDPFNLAEFRKDLNRFGLDIVPGHTVSDVLVLTETKALVHK